MKMMMMMMMMCRRTSMRFATASILLLSFLSQKETAASASASGWKKVPTAIWTRSRRILNLSSLFGSATHASPYDRVGGQSVYSVTTPWGSPYMTMEKLSDLDEVVQEERGTTSSSSSSSPQSLSEEQNELRPVALYFLDPDDALGLHGEMKQMENMNGADLRLTCFSLAKALRQAANLGNGLLTGIPPNPNDGTFRNDENGNMALRYKIVPPKRQLYYAARCIGRERVGLFGENAAEEAQAAVLGNSALEGNNLVRRREKRERKTPASKNRTPLQALNAHMEGYVGIPVFYSPHMQRRLPLLKRLTTGVRMETPMFFNYEDLVSSWNTMRQRQGRTTTSIAEQPEQVEVFNLWDLLTSMDRDQSKQKQSSKLLLSLKHGMETRFSMRPQEPDLGHITFIPSSRSSQYKEFIRARGNGKARLRPMR